MSYRNEVMALEPNDGSRSGFRKACAEVAARADTRIAELEAALSARNAEIMRLKSKVNATFDAIHEHASRAAAKRIFAVVKEFDHAIDAARGAG